VSVSQEQTLSGTGACVGWLGVVTGITAASTGGSLVHVMLIFKIIGDFLPPSAATALAVDTNTRQCAKTCFFRLRWIRQLRRYVDYETLYTLVRALVLSHLDYCNSLFASSSKSTIKRPQRVQDAAARLLCNAPPRAHASSLRKQLHWLPVSSRIQYKLCTIMFDVQHDRAPEYITDLCVPCQDSSLRSAARGNFQVRGTKLKLTTGAFSVAGPRHYNTLPIWLRQAGSRVTFCSKMKTHFLWSPYEIGQTIIFSSCGFFLLLLSFLFSSPNLSCRRLDIYHTSTHGVSLIVRI